MFNELLHLQSFLYLVFLYYCWLICKFNPKTDHFPTNRPFWSENRPFHKFDSFFHDSARRTLLWDLALVFAPLTLPLTDDGQKYMLAFRHLGLITSCPRWVLVFHEKIGNLTNFDYCTTRLPSEHMEVLIRVISLLVLSSSLQYFLYLPICPPWIKPPLNFYYVPLNLSTCMILTTFQLLNTSLILSTCLLISIVLFASFHLHEPPLQFSCWIYTRPLSICCIFFWLSSRYIWFSPQFTTPQHVSQYLPPKVVFSQDLLKLTHQAQGLGYVTKHLHCSTDVYPCDHHCSMVDLSRKIKRDGYSCLTREYMT